MTVAVVPVRAVEGEGEDEDEGEAGGAEAEAAGEVGQWVAQGPEAVDGVVEAMAEAAVAVAARTTADMSDWQVEREENSDKGT